jgi:hypothetical protein
VFQHGTCASVQPGVKLEVKGILESNATVTATRIIVLGTAGPNPNPNPTPKPGPDGEDEPETENEDEDGKGNGEKERREVEGEGTIASTLNACPAVTFVVNGITVTTTPTTEYREGDCPDLKRGARVQVKGIRLADGSVRAARVMFKRQRQEVEGDVTVDSVEGDCPSLTIVAGAFTVTTDDTTEFARPVRPCCPARGCRSRRSDSRTARSWRAGSCASAAARAQARRTATATRRDDASPQRPTRLSSILT